MGKGGHAAYKRRAAGIGDAVECVFVATNRSQDVIDTIAQPVNISAS